MAKIYIVTLDASYIFSNVGTFLQHWALRKTLSLMGHDSLRVAWESDKKNMSVSNYRLCVNFLIWLVKVTLHYLGMSKHPKFEKYNKFSFRDFIQAVLYRKCYVQNIGTCIEDTNTESDVLILGGDQVMDIKDFFLVSKIKASKYISYAASTDWKKNSKLTNWKKSISCNLSKFSYIGVRESAGVESLYNLGISAIKVADPVMLLTQSELDVFAGIKCSLKNSSMFAYFLNIPSKSDLNIEGLSYLSKSLGVELFMHGIQGAQYFIPNKYYKHMDPVELVRAIRDSEYFITNSFHGIVIALIFHKQFICIMQEKDDVVTQNIRQKELLDLVDLQHHNIKMEELTTKGQLLLKERIDWLKIDEILDDFRLFSLNWLKEAIDN